MHIYINYFNLIDFLGSEASSAVTSTVDEPVHAHQTQSLLNQSEPQPEPEPAAEPQPEPQPEPEPEPEQQPQQLNSADTMSDKLLPLFLVALMNTLWLIH